MARVTQTKLKSIPKSTFRPSMGCDPEIFVMNKEKNTTVIPAFTFLSRKSNRSEIYWDGFQAEFKTDADTCLDILQWNIFRRLYTLNKRAEKKKGYLSIQSVIKLPVDTLKKLPHEFVALGCKPSFNAYDTKSELITDPTELATRWSGGHIHFGGMDRPPDYKRLAKVCDTILGLWAVGAFQKFDDPIRRRYYGLAGEYRKPTYGKIWNYDLAKEVPNFGFEYRTLSNAWLAHPAIYHVTFEIARIALAIARKNELYALLVQSPLTEKAINTCDVELAHKLFMNNSVLFKHMFQRIRRMKAPIYVNTALRIEKEGIHNFIEKPDSVADNWHMEAYDPLTETFGGNYALYKGRFKEFVDAIR